MVCDPTVDEVAVDPWATPPLILFPSTFWLPLLFKSVLPPRVLLVTDVVVTVDVDEPDWPLDD